MGFYEAYTLPFELAHAPRFSSDIPSLARLSVDGQNINVSWTGIDAVDGYAVYRKSNNKKAGKAWRWIADVDADSNGYTDNGLNASTKYTYTVVPYRETGAQREYGCFDVTGVNATTKK